LILHVLSVKRETLVPLGRVTWGMGCREAEAPGGVAKTRWVPQFSTLFLKF
jgi:hypothetical protein